MVKGNSKPVKETRVNQAMLRNTETGKTYTYKDLQDEYRKQLNDKDDVSFEQYVQGLLDTNEFTDLTESRKEEGRAKQSYKDNNIVEYDVEGLSDGWNIVKYLKKNKYCLLSDEELKQVKSNADKWFDNNMIDFYVSIPSLVSHFKYDAFMGNVVKDIKESVNFGIKTEDDGDENDDVPNDEAEEELSALDQVLQNFKDKSPMHDRIVSEIIEDSEDYEGTKLEKIKGRLGDIAHGLQTGVVGSLVYYSDTVKFFDEYEFDIEDELVTYMENGLEPLEMLKNNCDEVEIIMQTDNAKNYVVWMVYQEIAYQLDTALDELDNTVEESKTLTETSSTEKYWDATEIDRKNFVSLLKFNFGTDAQGNNYIITNDGYEQERFSAKDDEEAKEHFAKYINK